jgi:hypothetical protein
VVASLEATRHVFTTLRIGEPFALRDGLFGWDAAWYADIARGGYGAVPKEGLRFFPLYPLLGKLVAYSPGVSARAGNLFVANVCALALGFVVYELAMREKHDAGLARRAVWLVFLVPPAFVLVMGYAEATFMLLSAIVLIAMRDKRWWLAGIAGALAGLVRPIGVLLVIPVAVEAWRRRSVGGFVAAAGPAVGAFGYLAWAEHRSHEFLYPLRAQQDKARRGAWVDPIRAIAHSVHETFSGGHVSAGIHVVSAVILIGLLVVLARNWPLSFTLYAGAVLFVALSSRNLDSLERYALSAVILIGLLVVLARNWPLSFTLYAGAVLFVALSSRNLDSLERYALSAVPFVFAGADLMRGENVDRTVMTLAVAGLVVASVLAFTQVLVP